VETPKFDAFKNIEEMEEHFNGAPAEKDALILGVAGLETAFITASMQAPAYARQYKDLLLASLKQVGLSDKWYDAVQEDLLAMCDHLDHEMEASRQNTDARRPLRAIREEIGLSIRDFAAKVGVSPSTIEKIESGLPVTATTKSKIAKALELPLEDIEFFVVE
jgi:DNA-binding XRE family transcriptional regulator